jgi:hypothetical protein
MAEEIVFKVGVNTGNSVNDLSKIDEELKDISKSSKAVGTDANQAFEELNKKVASGTLTMRESTKAIKEYQTIALNAGRESPVGQAAIQQAAQLQDKLTDLRNEITRASHDGKNMQAALQVGTSVVAGYGAVQGAMGLMGVENENLMKSLQKMQSVQMLLTSIEQIRANLEKESFMMQKLRTVATKVQTAAQYAYTIAVGGTTGAMKILRLAMLALPIVALIAGVVALIAVFSDFFSSQKQAEAQNDKLTASYDRQTEAMNRNNSKRTRDIENQIKLRTAQGASEDELHQLELDRMKEAEDQRVKSASEEKSMIEKRRKAYFKALEEGDEELAKKIKDEIGQHRTKYKDLKDLDGQYKKDVEVANTIFENKKTEDQNKADEKAANDRKSANDKARAAREKANADRLAKEKEAADRQLDLDRTLQDLLVANIVDTNQRALAQMALQQEREREELIKKFGDNTTLQAELQKKQQAELAALQDEQLAARTLKEQEEIKKASDLANVSAKAELESKLLQIQESFEAEQALKLELAKLEMDQALLNTELTAGEKLKIEEEYNKKVRELNDETKEHEKATSQEALDRQTEHAMRAIESIQNLSDTVFSIRMAFLKKGSKEEEKAARQQFKINKMMQLAGAIIAARKAIMTSLASAPVAVGGVPNPAGIASLAYVAAQQASTIAAIAATKFEGGGGGNDNSVAPPSITGGEGSTPQATVTATSGLAGSGQSQPAKVVLVDSEVKAMMDDSAKVNVISTMGE